MTELLANVGDVYNSLSFVVTSVAETIASTPMLLLFAVALPLVSFGAGLLLRVLHRV